MKLCIAAALMVCLLAGADAPKTKTPTDVQKLQGTWKLVAGEMDGKAMTEDQLKTGKLVIRDNQYTITLPGKDTFTGTEILNSTKSPKTINVTDDSGPNAGKKLLGIYELKGDEFRVAFAPSDKSRPTEFTTKPGTGSWMHLWKRVKQK
jgi:uncharacterized protein (TIGR03067 family)